jgi:hypothetical protein
MGKGLACPGPCEKTVADLIRLIEQNIHYSPVGENVMGNVRKNTYVHATFMLTAGVVFVLTGVATGRVTELPGLLGIVFLVYGAYTLWRGFRLPKQ